MKVWKARGHRPEIVGVGHRGDVPAVGQEAGGHVLGERVSVWPSMVTRLES